MELPDEPAWVTRFSKGNADCSPFVAREIADQVRKMLTHNREMEAIMSEVREVIAKAEQIGGES